MPRRKRHNEIPTLAELIREMGHGWALNLVQVLAFVVLALGVYFFVSHVAFAGLKASFDHIGK